MWDVTHPYVRHDLSIRKEFFSVEYRKYNLYTHTHSLSHTHTLRGMKGYNANEEFVSVEYRKYNLYTHTLSLSVLVSPSLLLSLFLSPYIDRRGAGVETRKNVRGEIGGWGRVPFNEPYAPSLSTIYDGAQGSLNS